MINKSKTYRIIISGGGTGGHIYPALAIANSLKENFDNIKLLFVGAYGKMEMQKVPEAGYPIKSIWISGIHRNLSWKNIVFPFKLIFSLIQAHRILNQYKPDLAIGVGGFASGPLLWMASEKRIPTLIQEQNSYAGITNKILARKADLICVAYEGMEKYFPKNKIVITGNPVRKDILHLSDSIQKGYDFFDFSNKKKTILIMGGSLGARTINQSVLHNIHEVIDKDLQLIWPIGKIYYDDYQQKIKGLNQNNLRTFDFLKEIDLAYAIADVVISRAGALSISELSVAGKAVVFVPSPNVAEDHQTKNAQALVNQNAALMVKDSDAKEKMMDIAFELLDHPDRQKSLEENIRKLAIPDASDRIVKQIESLLN